MFAMAESSEDLKREFEEFEQSEASLDSGLESPPRKSLPRWIFWVLVADLIIIAAVVMIVFAA